MDGRKSESHTILIAIEFLTFAISSINNFFIPPSTRLLLPDIASLHIFVFASERTTFIPENKTLKCIRLGWDDAGRL